MTPREGAGQLPVLLLYVDPLPNQLVALRRSVEALIFFDPPWRTGVRCLGEGR